MVADQGFLIAHTLKLNVIDREVTLGWQEQAMIDMQ
jgi:hypothetical protein